MSARWDEARRADMKALAERHGARLKKSGRNWIGPCPKGCASSDGFVVTPQERLFFCRPSGEGGGAIDMVMHIRSCDAKEAVDFIVGGAFSSSREASPAGHAPHDPMRPFNDALSLRTASAASRGLDVAAHEAVSLRCSPSLWHWPTKTKWPALLARVSLATGEDLTTHQTFLTRDGCKAELGDKTRLFVAGSKTLGGGVWFGVADPNREFIVGEGIESTISAMRVFSANAGCAALSAFGVSRLILPPAARIVRIFADHDAFGQGVASARVAAQRWRAEGREVAVSMSPNVGEDANDLWLKRLGKERRAS